MQVGSRVSCQLRGVRSQLALMPADHKSDGFDDGKRRNSGSPRAVTAV